MRIAIFTDTYLPDINGVATSIKLEVEQLEKMGHEVYIITSSNRKLSPKWEGNILRLTGIKMPKKMYNYKLSWFYSLRASRKLKKKNIDCVHIHSEFGVSTFGRIWAKLRKIPVVYTYHTMYEDYTHYVPGGKKGRGVIHKATLATSRLLADKCDELIVPTNKTRNKLRGYGVDKYINVIPTGIDLDKYNPSRYLKDDILKLRRKFISDDKKCFMFVGRIAKEKNLDVLLDVVGKIKKNNLKYKLLILGDGPYLKILKERSIQESLGQYISFLGRVPNENIGLYYQICDVFVSPSDSETQGLTYIEAMASGKPVIAINDAAAKEVVNDKINGWLFMSIDSLVEIFINICGMESSNFKSMSNRSLIKAEEYDAEKFGKKIESIILRAIDMY